jgi:predicted flap endonuclease-1-like 5' DNA nuclease
MVSVNGTLQVEKKKWDFSFLHENLQEILNENDIDQAMDFAKNALREAQTQENVEWTAKFQEILTQLIQTRNLYGAPSQESISNNQVIQSKSDDLTIIKGIGPSIASKLQANGFNTIKEIMTSTPEQIARIPGIGVATANKMITNAKACISESEDQFIPNSKNLASAIAKDLTACEKIKFKAQENIAKSKNLNEWFNPIQDQEPIESTILSDLGVKRVNLNVSTRKRDTEENPTETKAKLVEEVCEGEDLSNSEECEVKPLRNQVTISPVQSHRIDSETESLSKPVPMPEIEISQKIVPVKAPKIDTSQYCQTIATSIKERQFHELSLNNQGTRELKRGIDNFACKIVMVSNNLHLILLIPIKFLHSQNPLFISEMRVLKPVSASKFTSLQYVPDSVAEAHVRQLKKVSDAMFDNFTDEEALHALISRYFGLDAIVQKGFKQKPLFLACGEIEYKIVIDPILVTNQSVSSIEKTVPFPYQHSSNLHVVELEELNELMEFLEQKHVLLMAQDSASSSLVKQVKMKTAFYKNLKNYSLPFLFFGGIFSFFLVMQMRDLIRLLMSLGFALIFIYGGAIALVLYQYFQATNKMAINFKMPHHKKQLELHKEDLILIREEFSENWMIQLEHEVKKAVCSSKKNRFTSFQTKRSGIESQNDDNSIRDDQLDLEQFEAETLVKETEFERKQDLNTLNDPILSKYRSFLDD